MFNYDTYTYTFILLGCQVDIKPEQVDVGVQCDLPCHPKKTLSIGMQSGVPNPLAASSPRTIPTSCSESELSEVDEVLDMSTGTYYPPSHESESS